MYRLFESGVSLAEDGVRLILRGIIEGDFAVLLRVRSGIVVIVGIGIGSGCCVVGEDLLGGIGGCIMDILFNRLASVGLIVLAPRPLALPD